MTALTGTLDGWAGTVRSVRWSPLLGTPAATVVGLLLLDALDPAGPAMEVAGENGLALAAATAAFAIDDPSADAAPGTPTEAPARLRARAAVMLPVVAVGWLVGRWVLCASIGAPPTAGLGHRALAAAAVAAVACGVAAVAGRLWAVPSPGAAGVAAVVVLGVARHVVPVGWLEPAPPASVTAAAAVLLGGVAIAVATREPAG